MNEGTYKRRGNGRYRRLSSGAISRATSTSDCGCDPCVPCAGCADAVDGITVTLPAMAIAFPGCTHCYDALGNPAYSIKISGLAAFPGGTYCLPFVSACAWRLTITYTDVQVSYYNADDDDSGCTDSLFFAVSNTLDINLSIDDIGGGVTQLQLYAGVGGVAADPEDDGLVAGRIFDTGRLILGSGDRPCSGSAFALTGEAATGGPCDGTSSLGFGPGRWITDGGGTAYITVGC